MFRLRGEDRITDQEVRARTGRDWHQWYALLDDVGADRGAHGRIAGYLRLAHGLSTWWAQTVTIRYVLDRTPGAGE